MIPTFYNEAAVKIGEDTLRLVINFKTLDAAESLIGRPFDDILADLTSKDPAPGQALQGKVVWALLQEQHPDITLDQIGSLLFGDDSTVVGMALGKLLIAAFPTSVKEKGANPPKPRGASKTSS